MGNDCPTPSVLTRTRWNSWNPRRSVWARRPRTVCAGMVAEEPVVIVGRDPLYGVRHATKGPAGCAAPVAHTLSHNGRGAGVVLRCLQRGRTYGARRTAEIAHCGGRSTGRGRAVRVSAARVGRPGARPRRGRRPPRRGARPSRIFGDWRGSEPAHARSCGGDENGASGRGAGAPAAAPCGFSNRSGSPSGSSGCSLRATRSPSSPHAKTSRHSSSRPASTSRRARASPSILSLPPPRWLFPDDVDPHEGVQPERAVFTPHLHSRRTRQGHRDIHRLLLRHFTAGEVDHALAATGFEPLSRDRDFEGRAWEPGSDRMVVVAQARTAPSAAS